MSNAEHKPTLNEEAARERYEAWLIEVLKHAGENRAIGQLLFPASNLVCSIIAFAITREADKSQQAAMVDKAVAKLKSQIEERIRNVETVEAKLAEAIERSGL